MFVLREIEGVIGILQGLDASNVCTYAFVKKKFLRVKTSTLKFLLLECVSNGCQECQC